MFHRHFKISRATIARRTGVCLRKSCAVSAKAEIGTVKKSTFRYLLLPSDTFRQPSANLPDQRILEF
jgi:hypothetical protein